MHAWPARLAKRAGRAGTPSYVHTTVLTSQILNLDKLTQGGRFIYFWPSPALVAWCLDKIGHGDGACVELRSLAGGFRLGSPMLEYNYHPQQPLKLNMLYSFPIRVPDGAP